jgi:ectoine hydroxylase-related dioxygenase (phytanoyl-CoA dioxygenase family)
MRDAVWELLQRRDGIDPLDPSTWTIRQPTGFQELGRAGVFNALGARELCDVIDEILGQGRWSRPRYWGAPLITFPDATSRWDVPSSQWHTDFVAQGASEALPGVRLLAFLAPVVPSGGGTVVLAGSHRLVRLLVGGCDPGQVFQSTELRRILTGRYPWLRGLMSPDDSVERIARFMDRGAVLDGVDVRVVELVGEAGDVILMHPWCFHAPAPNCATEVRMMVSHSVFRTDALAPPC